MEMNSVGWFEIYVDDMDRATKFYEAVFDTKLEELPNPTGDGAVLRMFPGNPEHAGSSGAIVKMEGMGPSVGGTLVYFSSADCAIEEARIAAAGGQVTQSKMSIGQFGFIVLAMDSEGNMIGVHSQQ